MSAFSQRLRKLETVRGLSAPALPPLVYDILNAQGSSSGNYLIAGDRFGEFRQATAAEVASLFDRNKPAGRTDGAIKRRTFSKD